MIRTLMSKYSKLVKNQCTREFHTLYKCLRYINVVYELLVVCKDVNKSCKDQREAGNT